MCLSSMYRAACICIPVFLFTLTKSPAAEKWPLDKILSQALENSPHLKSSEKEVESAQALARQAGRWDNPDLSVTYGPMTQGNLTGKSLDVAVRQPIPLFGQKSIAEDIGHTRAKILSLETEEKSRLLVQKVTRLSFELASLLEEEKHVSHRRESLSDIVRFLETRPLASPRQIVEKGLILARARETEEELLKISRTREKVWTELNVFLALEQIIEPQLEWENLPQPPEKEALWNEVEAQNPSVRKSQNRLQMATLTESQARKKALPDVRIGAAYNEQTAELPQKVHAGVLELSIPLFNRGSDERAAARAQKESESYKLEVSRRELRAQFASQWATYEENKKRMALYPFKVLAESHQQAKVGAQGWRRGLVQTAEFLELEHQMHLQVVKYYQVRIDYLDSVEQLLLLAGRPSRAR